METITDRVKLSYLQPWTVDGCAAARQNLFPFVVLAANGNLNLDGHAITIDMAPTVILFLALQQHGRWMEVPEEEEEDMLARQHELTPAP